jgi:hypothetical protein
VSLLGSLDPVRELPRILLMDEEPLAECVLLERLPLGPQRVVLTHLLQLRLRLEYLVLESADRRPQ